MKKSLILLALFSTSSFAKVMQFEASKLDSARKKGFISSDTLMVKVQNSAPEILSYLGDFTPFFNAPDGTWGRLKLFLIPHPIF